MVDVAWFRAQKVSGAHDFAAPPPGLLADLYDLTMKFGMDDPRGPIRRVSLPGDRPVHVSAVSAEGNMNMVVSAHGGGAFIGEHCVGFVLSDPLPSGLIWDVRISVDEVRAFIAAIDAEMRGVPGAFDPATGERRRSPRKTGVELVLPIDRFLKDRGDIIIVPQGFDPDEYRSLFDRPEALHVLTRDDGVRVLCRVEDVAYIMKRSEVIRQLLRVRHGIMDGDMNGLTREQQVSILKQAFRILKRMHN